MSWSSVLCHSIVREIILRSIQRGMFEGSHLLHGPHGAGQDQIALAIAKTRMCPEVEQDFCDTCDTCTRISAQTYPDVIHLYPEKDWDEPEKTRKDYSIGHMRLVNQFARQQPYEAERKLFLVHRADRIGLEAANSILKIIEEPPDHVMFLLITDAIHSMLPTILSRCRKIQVLPLETDALAGYLEEKVDRDKALTIARAAGGLVQSAEDLIDSDFLAQRDEVLEWMYTLRTNPTRLDEAIDWLAKDKAAFPQRMNLMTTLLRDALLIVAGMPDGPLHHPDRVERIRKVWGTCPVEKVLHLLERILEFKEMQRFNPNPAIGVTHVLTEQSRTAN